MRAYSVLRGALFVTLYFVALPGAFIALNERLRWPRWQDPVLIAVGTLLILAALGVCLSCARLFWRLGRGTPVPSEPPGRLVVSGLFRVSRNPMCVAYIALGAGIFFIAGHLALLLYPLALCLLAEIYSEAPK